jgi:ribokinase
VKAELLRPHTHLVLQNEIPFEDTLACIVATRSDVSVIYNPSPLPSSEQLSSIPWDKVRWLVVNEIEAMGLLSYIQDAESGVSDESDLPHAWSIPCPSLKPHFRTLFRLSRLPSFSTTGVVCTLGPHGVVAFIPWLSVSKSVMHAEPIYLPAATLRGDIRDTTGAGDCFTGYLTAGLMESEGKTTIEREDYVAILQRCVHVGTSASVTMLGN